MTKGILLELQYDKILTLCKTHEDLEKKFLKFQKQFFQENKSYPLDYIMNLPESHFGQDEVQEKYAAINRENIFKNVVMRRIKEIREIKAKPKLFQQLETKNISDWKARIQIKRKIREMKEKQAAEQFEDEVTDQFKKLISKLERTLKVLTAENIALNNIETKLIELSKGNVTTVRRPSVLAIKKKVEETQKPKKTRIQAYERIEDENYDSGNEEAKASRIQEITQANMGIKNLVDGINISGKQREELEFPSQVNLHCLKLT
eukprot:CAMPEP_0197017436 /NCGR_PEP_ID=MMETSP1380-20130617/79541_1 /TAXON_ID=5936 /ORGANISM="Euplotes crassus, Strain CT5" /LENGTH=261 /DNA_ID=CAMNT_0042444533 /DNA_START=2404 /DNA_END=3186 /DNA_ORIENTATION=+